MAIFVLWLIIIGLRRFCRRSFLSELVAGSFECDSRLCRRGSSATASSWLTMPGYLTYRGRAVRDTE